MDNEVGETTKNLADTLQDVPLGIIDAISKKVKEADPEMSEKLTQIMAKFDQMSPEEREALQVKIREGLQKKFAEKLGEGLSDEIMFKIYTRLAIFAFIVLVIMVILCFCCYKGYKSLRARYGRAQVAKTETLKQNEAQKGKKKNERKKDEKKNK